MTKSVSSHQDTFQNNSIKFNLQNDFKTLGKYLPLSQGSWETDEEDGPDFPDFLNFFFQMMSSQMFGK